MSKILNGLRWLFILRPAHIQLCVGLRKVQDRFEWMGLPRGWVWSDANNAVSGGAERRTLDGLVGGLNQEGRR